MESVSIVSAFFDLNRGGWNSSSRGREDYLRHFHFWAKVKNNLVVYTDRDMAERVMSVRKEYGLENLTRVIVIDDYTVLDPSLLESIKIAMEAPHAQNFHMKPNHPESWSPEYNYVMLLKSWCVCDAISMGYVDGMIAWVDFGFNKSGVLYTNSDSFNFEWKVNVSPKVHYYSVNQIDNIPIYEIIQRMDTYIQGCSFMAPASIWPKLWGYIRTSMLELNTCGLCDDDQVLMLMAYRKEPSLFEIHNCRWFGMFDLTVPDHFELRPIVVEKLSLKNKLKKLKADYRTKTTIFNYSVKQYKLLSKRNTIND